jgi:hypothetical protein
MNSPLVNDLVFMRSIRAQKRRRNKKRRMNNEAKMRRYLVAILTKLDEDKMSKDIE